MTKAFMLLAAGATLVGGPAFAAERLSGEARLAKALEGRVAGAPVHCINPRLNSETKVIDKTAIVYGSGRTIYVQRPDNASWLRGDDVLVTELHGSGQLCDVDVVKLHDRAGLWPRGFVALNAFVPYTRASRN